MAKKKKGLTDKQINKIIGDIDTSRPVETHDSELKMHLNSLRQIMQHCMDTSSTKEEGLTKVGLLLYPHRKFFESGGKTMKKAFALAEKKIARSKK